MDRVFDLAVIGGGINGAGIARDAAGRGASVYLCEKGDLASATSSASTKLVHGGLRYLEYYEFRLVREALIEREVLWRIAPHIIGPLRFVLPQRPGMRPAWLLRLGLFLYDHLGGRKLLPATATRDLRHDVTGAPLLPGVFSKGFEYSDCRIDDARMVVLNAIDARSRGAVIETRAAAIAARRVGSLWHVDVRDMRTGGVKTVTARALVNAAGPWVAEVLGNIAGAAAGARVRLVQGSHIVVPKLYDHDRCYIFQNPDGRIVFAIPYETDFTLIGTTDRDYVGDPGAVAATADEIDYLCAAASANFAGPVTPADVVWSWSGVRPLYDDGASEARAATRDYVLELDLPDNGPPLLSVFGGKITTYRRLAEAALAKLAQRLPALARRTGWTATAPLPGGDFPVDGRAALAAEIHRRHPFLTEDEAARFAALYGTRAFQMLDGAAGRDDLGQMFGGDLSEREVRYLIAEEWAETADDVIWRRTKRGLRMNCDETVTLDLFMAGVTAAAELAEERAYSGA
jgi:glycerol-3-phosphate dehydrogenase